MANWVNGYIIPYGTKQEIEEFTKYLNDQEKWKYVINRNCPPHETMQENEIHIYDNNASHAIEIAEEMEEKFRQSIFHFFVCDEMNGFGWGINYMNSVETCIFYEEDPKDNNYLVPTEITSNWITDEYIAKRKKTDCESL